MKIMGYNYTLETGTEEDMLGHLGLHFPKTQRIRIAFDLCPQQKSSTILHEILESINYHCELELGHSAIMTLEAALFQTLIDNGVDLTPLEMK